MLSCSTRNRMFTLRNLKKCALVCTTRRSTAFNIASVASQFFPVLCRHCFGQHRYTSYVYIFERALRWRENATIYKEQMQTKYSDVINFFSIIASYCCSLDPPLYCPGLYRPVLCFCPLDD